MAKVSPLTVCCGDSFDSIDSNGSKSLKTTSSRASSNPSQSCNILVSRHKRWLRRDPIVVHMNRLYLTVHATLKAPCSVSIGEMCKCVVSWEQCSYWLIADIRCQSRKMTSC